MASSTASVSGLVSGLDTATIISQLMQVEANPQTLLKSRLSTEKSSISTLQSLNSSFAALATKAADLAKKTAWTPFTTTTTSPKVTATAGPTAGPGTLSFTVGSTASLHQLSFNQAALSTDVVTSGSTSVTLDTLDGNTVSIDTGDGTLDSLVSALNSANAGVSARTVKLDDGSFRLQVVSSTTGAASDFTLTNTDGTPILGGAAVIAGRDASITVGSDTVHSATNTFSGLVTGLDITLAADTAAGTAVDITSARDTTTAQSSVQGLVDAANDLLSQIDKLTAYNATTKTSGPLAGDATIRALRTKVLDAVTRTADGSSMSALGVQTDRYGKITFDTAVFSTAYATDAQGVAARLGATATDAVPGFAARLAAAADSASNATNGSLTTSIVNRQSSATQMQTAIDNWDVRLATKQAALNRQFTALEVSLGKLKNQSSWLAGQINALPTASSSR